MQLLTVAQQQCCGKASDNYQQVDQVVALAEGQALNVACACESNHAQAANRDGLAAETARGFASLDQAVLDVVCCNSDALELGSSNRASMVAAGCGCGPANEASAVFSDDRERVLGVELLDVVPADLNAAHGVHHGHALIGDHQFGAHQTEPGQGDHEGAPSPRRQVLPIANQDAQGNQADNCCQRDAAPGSKNLHVSHVSIIAGDVK